MKNNSNTLIQTILITLLIGILIFMVILILEQLGVGMQEYYKETCDEMDGTLIFYECQNLLWVTPCSELKTGMWCKLNNGTEIDITIRNIIN